LGTPHFSVAWVVLFSFQRPVKHANLKIDAPRRFGNATFQCGMGFFGKLENMPN